jgi:sigma-54 specific flagellar transcriptional regulator A
MSLIGPTDVPFLQALSKLVSANPFSPTWIDLEHEALGKELPTEPTVHLLDEGRDGEIQILLDLDQRVQSLAEHFCDRLAEGARPTTQESEFYQHLILYLLYRRYRLRFDKLIEETLPEQDAPRVAFWREFQQDFHHYFARLPGRTLLCRLDCDHVFACFFQIRRAFQQVFWSMVGRSKHSILLREEVWKSIFTHDMRRYLRMLYARMNDVNTLITGPTGTGKELVAKAIGFSQYVPFEPRNERFAVNFRQSFHPLNLSAMPSSLIEAQLFGHTDDAYSGAKRDREGWLHKCSSPHSAIFLDEIGDVSASVQVKLLRVLENRVFQRVGDTADRIFEGKIVAATNRDLASEVHRGRFRRDLYYRLSADTIITPSLREQLDDCPDDLHDLVLFLARRVLRIRVEEADVEKEAECLAADVETWIKRKLGADYRWPGNMRELEQCVRSILVRKSYRPAQHAKSDRESELHGALLSAAENGLTAKELERRYCAVALEKTGSYQQGARLLHMNRQTFTKRCREGASSAPCGAPRRPR